MVCSSPLHDTDLASQAVSPMEPGRVWECFFNVFFAWLFFIQRCSRHANQAECVNVGMCECVIAFAPVLCTWPR